MEKPPPKHFRVSPGGTVSSLLSWRVSHTKETEVLFLPISNQNCDFGRNCSSVVEPLHQGYESKPEGGGLEGGEVLPYMAGGLLIWPIRGRAAGQSMVFGLPVLNRVYFAIFCLSKPS